MLRTGTLTTIWLLLAFFLQLPAYGALTPEAEKEHKGLFREFVRLQNYGTEEEFQQQADTYLGFLKQNRMDTEYFKIKTNVGFFLIEHQHPLKAMQTAMELDGEIRAKGDTSLLYLASGLKGDIYKMTHNIPKADSTYKKALLDVGQKDKKFEMLVHMSLAEVNLTTDPDKALEWADKALNEADSLKNFEYQSMALGIRCYLFFMMADRHSFEQTERRFKQLEAEFAQLEADGKALGRQRFSHRYDAVMEVARTAFAGDYEKAIEMAEREQLNVDRQMVVFRIFGMEGLAEKDKANLRLRWGFAAMTALYIFVYIMGRRRLMLKIWKRQKELKVAQAQAETANRMKAAFIRSMSHEIRTPLNAINGFTQVLCSQDFDLSDEEKKDLKERVTSNTEAITLIINELLELAAGESVTLDESNLTAVCPNKVCREALKRAGQHNEKGLRMTFSSELADDFSFNSNEETIAQILEKIIDNAKKFTSEGSIGLHVAATNGQIEMSVADTGIGIPEERQQDVFDNFVKLDEYAEGIGLGLPICQRLAHSLGGSVALDTSYKKGSRFVLRLPLR